MDRRLAWERVKRFLDDGDDEEETEDETAKTSSTLLSSFLNPP